VFGLMRDRPLRISGLLGHAARYHRKAEIGSKTCEATIDPSSDAGLCSRDRLPLACRGVSADQGPTEKQRPCPN
jgi:hypothetical protein